MFLTRTQKQADGIAAELDTQGIIYRSQSSVGGSWEKRLRLLRALDVLEGVSRKAGRSQKSIDQYGGPVDDRHQSSRALSYDDARALLRHSHGRYLDSDDDEREEWLSEYALESSGPVPLSEFGEHVSGKWWSRYNGGADSIENFTRLSDADRVALGAAWNRYDRYDIAVEDQPTRILTIHASKGAEASDVIVYDGITGRIQDSLENDAGARENEARCWYVALTRASRRLHIIRNSFAWTDDYLPHDLEPRAAQAAADHAIASDGGERE
jgi:DNA helicase-2/ATP-dependent DNA helicase PcrA